MLPDSGLHNRFSIRSDMSLCEGTLNRNPRRPSDHSIFVASSDDKRSTTASDLSNVVTLSAKVGTFSVDLEERRLLYPTCPPTLFSKVAAIFLSVTVKVLIPFSSEASNLSWSWIQRQTPSNWEELAIKRSDSLAGLPSMTTEAFEGWLKLDIDEQKEMTE